MILGLLSMTVAQGAVLLGAGALLRRLRTGTAHLDAVLFMVLRLGLVSAVVLAAGLLGRLDAVSLGIAGVVVAVALFAAGEHRRLSLPRLPPIGRVGTALVIVLVARILAQVWFFSPHLGDPVTYHLPKIAEWIRAGGFTREMGLHPHVSFPAGFELLETWWVVFLRHDLLIEMAGVEVLALGFAATYSLARQLGLEERSAFLGAVAFALAPGPYFNALSCLNDSAVAAFWLAAAALIWGRGGLALAMIPVSLGLGVKPTFAFALPGLVVLALLMRCLPRCAAPSPRLRVLLAGLAALVGGYWYLRNLAWFGNPFHPAAVSGYDHPVPAQYGPRLTSLGANLSAFVGSRAQDSLGPYSADVWDISGWGPLSFAVGAIALIVLLRTDPAPRSLAAAFGLSILAVFALVKVDPWCMRFIFFAPAIFAVAAIWMSERVRWVRGVVAACLLYQFAGTFLPHDLRRDDFFVLARQEWRTRSADRISRAKCPVETDTLACFGAFSGGESLLYRPDYSRKVIHLRSRSAEALLDDMRTGGARVLYSSPLSEREKAIVRDAVLQGTLEPLEGRFYRLRAVVGVGPGRR